MNLRTFRIKLLNGIVLSLIGLWGGALARHLFGRDDWVAVPSFITAYLCCFGGVILVAAAFIDRDDPPK